MRSFRNPNMRAGVDPVGELRKPGEEQAERLGAAAWKPFLLPHLVQSARVASVPQDEVARADLEPARDPDIDRVRFREGGARRTGRRRDEIDNLHNVTTRT